MYVTGAPDHFAGYDADRDFLLIICSNNASLLAPFRSHGDVKRPKIATFLDSLLLNTFARDEPLGISR